MKRSSVGHMNCSIARSLDIIGEWWTPLILRNLFFGQHRFEVIQADLGIARNILSDRLATLVEHGVVERQKYQDHPERYEYRLTQMGAELLPVLLMITKWGDRWLAGDEGPPLRFVHLACDHDADAQLVCSHCGDELHFGDLRARKGPGWRPSPAPS